METFDAAGLKAYEVTQSFIMAVNGVFFLSRKVGVQPIPSDLELGKKNLLTASQLFNKNLNNLINIYDRDSGSQVTQVVKEKIENIAAQMVKKGERAIVTGVANGAARLLGNAAHGAMGRLVAKAAQAVDLSVVDTAGRTWRDPSRLVQTIVRDHYYQQTVESKISQLREEGAAFFVVGDQGYSIALFEEVRHQLFHPNSPQLPERFDV